MLQYGSKKFSKKTLGEKNEDKIIEIATQGFSSLAVQSESGLKIREVGPKEKKKVFVFVFFFCKGHFLPLTLLQTELFYLFLLKV